MKSTINNNAIDYLPQFEAAARLLDKDLLQKKQLQARAGIWMQSAVLKLSKPAWVNPSADLFQPGSSIFFSVWINDTAKKDNKLNYNIHALKLRQLKGYVIESRKFAAVFRQSFRPYEKYWPNVSTQYGPLTLMEGWVPVNLDAFRHAIVDLAKQFLTMEHLIDESLIHFIAKQK